MKKILLVSLVILISMNLLSCSLNKSNEKIEIRDIKIQVDKDNGINELGEKEQNEQNDDVNNSDSESTDIVNAITKVAREGKQTVSIESVSNDNRINIKDYYKITGTDEYNGGNIYEPDTNSDDLFTLNLSEDVVIILTQYYYKNDEIHPITIEEFRKYIKNEEGLSEFEIEINNSIVTEISEIYCP